MQVPGILPSFGNTQLVREVTVNHSYAGSNPAYQAIRKMYFNVDGSVAEKRGTVLLRLDKQGQYLSLLPF